MKIHIVKIGGHIINDPKLLNISIQSFCKLEGYKIFIHGGGEKANNVMDRMGIPKKMIRGRRVTDKKTLEVVVMIYAGYINKNIVSLLQGYNCNALGLSGADGNCIKSFFRSKEKNIDYGYVGDIDIKNINIHFIKLLLKNDLVPVLCPITHNGYGTLLNTNADTISSHIAIALSNDNNQVDLHLCFEKKGVLRNINNPKSFLKKINFDLFQKMKQDHTIFNGMIPKLENAFFAFQNGVKKVSIGHPHYLNEIHNNTVLCL
ncbi:acetylglutamate kinase [Blattabacterium cuenoti]|uniref:acetylglutamate kinase n=1 Tax=Blattabacterium cuenoti TaxID=1653831 RepID=UPI00163BDEDF|nr:acetylglutamate kinase [Blattabacterium cuenoti]